MKQTDQQQLQQLRQINSTLALYSTNLQTKIRDPSTLLDLKMASVSESVGLFFQNATPSIRAKFAYSIQKEIRKFLKNFAFDKLKYLSQSDQVEQFKFVDQVNQIWQNYQRFIYGLQFVLHKTSNSFNNFYRRQNTFTQQITQQQKQDNIDLNYKNQVTALPTMAVNQLKQFLQINQFKIRLQKKFVIHFCNLIKKQRDGINISRQKTNGVLELFQSTYLDYDCDVQKVQGGKIHIVRKANANAPASRKSTISSYFDHTYLNKLFDTCRQYYHRWVDVSALQMNSGDQLKQMIQYLSLEQDRAKYYVHQYKNQDKYLAVVQSGLIQYKFKQRLQKKSGLKQFLINYQPGKAQGKQQIQNFWKIYKRVFKKQDKRKLILTEYQEYLKQQARNISSQVEKPAQFIQQAVKLNKKNIQIILLLGKTLQIDRIRKQVLQDMLLMKYCDKQNIKDYFGAKHWAIFLNIKLKVKYSKSQKYSQQQMDLMNLFKLLRKTSVAIKQHCKLLNSRLLDQVDMSLNTQYFNALELQQFILEQIKKQTSQNDIKQIQSCLKDIKNSYEQRPKQRQKLNKFNFFNQLTKKSGNHWVDTAIYDIQPPQVLRACIDSLRKQFQGSNFAFEFQNGTSLFTGTFPKQTLKFQFKNIYMIILLLLDQKSNKKMFYTDLTKSIKAVGSQKTTNELIKNLIQLQKFGIIRTNKQIDQQHVSQIWTWFPSDYLQINTNFAPEKKVPTFRTANLAALPQFVRKAFQSKLNLIQQQQKNMQKDRRARVQSKCVQLLKFAQTNDAGKGTISFQQILNQLSKSNRQDNVNSGYLKQVMQHLINNGYCQRLQQKRNVFRYIT